MDQVFFYPARPVKISEDGFIFQEIPHVNHLFHVKETLDIEMFICMAVFFSSLRLKP